MCFFSAIIEGHRMNLESIYPDVNNLPTTIKVILCSQKKIHKCAWSGIRTQAFGLRVLCNNHSAKIECLSVYFSRKWRSQNFWAVNFSSTFVVVKPPFIVSLCWMVDTSESNGVNSTRMIPAYNRSPRTCMPQWGVVACRLRVHPTNTGSPIGRTRWRH